jgi:CheY-like chemotaxis protein
MGVFSFSKLWSSPRSEVRPTALILESNAELREALAGALLGHGYEVTRAASVEEAQNLLEQRSFDRIYGDQALLVPDPEPSGARVPVGPRAEDLSNGMAWIKIDQVVPWSVAVQLLDILSKGAGSRRTLS